MGILIYFLIGLIFAVLLIIFHTAKEMGRHWNIGEGILDFMGIHDSGDLGCAAFLMFALWPVVFFIGFVFIGVGLIILFLESFGDWITEKTKKLFK